MILLWCVTAAALALALVGWSKARRTGRRLEQLTDMYWELKYQHGELRAQLQRPVGSEASATATPTPRSQPTDAFVPIASLRR
jgi:hypothetical protein